MSVFQILMLAVTAFFAYKVYEHINTLEDPPEPKPSRDSLSSFDPEILMEKADGMVQEGDFKRAAGLLQEAHAKAPENTEILNKLGFVLAKNGDLQAAIETYLKSLTLDERDDVTHNALASLYRRTSEFDKAQQHYERALELDDAYEVTYYNFANLLVQMGEKEKALTMYEKALELNPDFQEAAQELAHLRQ